MKRPQEVAILLATLMTLCGATPAQQVYRCGNTYSQSPCEGGGAVPASDPRSTAQKSQAEQAARREARQASELEQRRLREERGLPPTKDGDKERSEAGTRSSNGKTQASVKPVSKSAAADHAHGRNNPVDENDDVKKAAKKKKEPEYFTVRPPGESGKKKPTKTP